MIFTISYLVILMGLMWWGLSSGSAGICSVFSLVKTEANVRTSKMAYLELGRNL